MIVALPKSPFERISRSEITKTRPALEHAGYACEECESPDGLRVVEGYRELVVLCPRCTVPSVFLRVLARRKTARRITTTIETKKGAIGRVHSDRPPTARERRMLGAVMDAAVERISKGR